MVRGGGVGAKKQTKHRQQVRQQEPIANHNKVNRRYLSLFNKTRTSTKKRTIMAANEQTPIIKQTLSTRSVNVREQMRQINFVDGK